MPKKSFAFISKLLSASILFVPPSYAAEEGVEAGFYLCNSEVEAINCEQEKYSLITDKSLIKKLEKEVEKKKIKIEDLDVKIKAITADENSFARPVRHIRKISGEALESGKLSAEELELRVREGAGEQNSFARPVRHIRKISGEALESGKVKIESDE